MLRIGDLAEQVGVTTSAIRFYETKGLLRPDERVAGQRRYRPAAVDRLRLVVTLRGAGLSCEDIATALDRSPDRAADRRRRAAVRAAELREQVTTTLSALVVVEHAAHCARPADDETCTAEILAQREEVLRRAGALLDPAGGRPVVPGPISA